ncbi:MAG: PspC domain-containing protein [Bacteroidota bacterium]
MNKTIAVNISGVFFHIDEDAYKILEAYLDSLKKHFDGTPGKDEIMQDIELRIAEIFQTKINPVKQLILLPDVEEAIGILGKPQEISNAEGNEQPEPEKLKTGTRRLYRDTDDRILGGVASGLGHYFSIDPVWFRLAFLVMMFIFGSSVLVYIVLWAIIPKAGSTEEKLEMKGDHITIDTIEKNIREEMEDLKIRFKEMKEDGHRYSRHERRERIRKMREMKRRTPYVDYAPKVQGATLKVINVFENILFYSIKAVLMVVGIALLILGIFLTFALIFSLTGSENLLMITHWGISTVSVPALASIIFETSTQATMAIVAVTLLVGVPIMMIIFNSIRLIFGRKKKIRVVSVTASLLWLTGLLLGIVVAFQVAHSFREKGIKKTEVQVLQPKNNVLFIDIAESPFKIENLEENHDQIVLHGWHYSIADDHFVNYGFPEVKIIPCSGKDFKITIMKSSRGHSIPDGRARASMVEFNVNQTDSLIVLDNFFKLPQSEKWRNQTVKVVIEVPEGKSVHLGKSMESIIYNDENNESSWNEEMLNRTMIMTAHGLVPGVADTNITKTIPVTKK